MKGREEMNDLTKRYSLSFPTREEREWQGKGGEVQMTDGGWTEYFAAIL